MYSIEVNTLTAEHFREVRDMCGLARIDAEVVRRALSRSVLTMRAATEDGSTAGMLRVVGDGVVVFMLYDLMICPRFRGLGIASEMVRRMIQIVRGGVSPNAWACINLIAAPGKEPFYRRLGFAELSRGETGSAMQYYLTGEK